MAISVSEAASRLKIHPLNLLLKIFPMVGAIEDCWPALDAGYVDTIRALSVGGQPSSPNEASPAAQEPSTPEGAPSAPSRLGRGSIRVLEKLWRQDRWGGRGVAWDTLHNHFCRDVENLEEALEELVEEGLLLSPSKHGPFSLDPNKKGDIERIVRSSLKRPS